MDGWSHQTDQNYKLRVSPRTKQCPHPKAPIHHIIKFQERENPWYKQNIASLSRLMRDRRTRPMDDAVWLVEYLARTRGAEHLKVNSRHLGGWGKIYHLSSRFKNVLFCRTSRVLFCGRSSHPWISSGGLSPLPLQHPSSSTQSLPFLKKAKRAMTQARTTSEKDTRLSTETHPK